MPGGLQEKASKEDSVPDLVLTGHDDVAQFALAASRISPTVASGGQDKRVLLWDLQDQLQALKAGQLGGSAGGFGTVPLPPGCAH